LQESGGIKPIQKICWKLNDYDVKCTICNYKKQILIFCYWNEFFFYRKFITAHFKASKLPFYVRAQDICIFWYGIPLRDHDMLFDVENKKFNLCIKFVHYEIIRPFNEDPRLQWDFLKLIFNLKYVWRDWFRVIRQIQSDHKVTELGMSWIQQISMYR